MGETLQLLKKSAYNYPSKVYLNPCKYWTVRYNTVQNAKAVILHQWGIGGLT